MSFFLAIIKPSYWLTHQHPVPEQWKAALTILFGVLLVLGLVCLLMARYKSFLTPVRTLLRKVGFFGLWMGVVGYLLLFFSLQRLAYLSARLWYLLWLVLALCWLYAILRYALKDMGKNIRFQKEKEAREKYWPKPNR